MVVGILKPSSFTMDKKPDPPGVRAVALPREVSFVETDRPVRKPVRKLWDCKLDTEPVNGKFRCGCGVEDHLSILFECMTL